MPNGNTIFQENGTERMRMDTSGRLLIKHNTYDVDNAKVFSQTGQVENSLYSKWRCLARTQTII